MNIHDFSIYAPCQFAAEAFFSNNPNSPSGGISVDTSSLDKINLALQDGNNSGTRLPPAEIANFISTLQEIPGAGPLDAPGTVYILQTPNDITGLSATLMKVNGEIILSVRSTEWNPPIRDEADYDADTQILHNGFAFAQIASLQKWFKSAAVQNVLGKNPGAPLVVTGYSLGGSVAQGFALMNPGAVSNLVLFNSAGIATMAGDQQKVEKDVATIVNGLLADATIEAQLGVPQGAQPGLTGTKNIDAFYDYINKTIDDKLSIPNDIYTRSLIWSTWGNLTFKYSGQVSAIRGQEQGPFYFVSSSGQRLSNDGKTSAGVYIGKIPLFEKNAWDLYAGDEVANARARGLPTHGLKKLYHEIVDVLGPSHSIAAINRAVWTYQASNTLHLTGRNSDISLIQTDVPLERALVEGFGISEDNSNSFINFGAALTNAIQLAENLDSLEGVDTNSILKSDQRLYTQLQAAQSWYSNTADASVTLVSLMTRDDIVARLSLNDSQVKQALAGSLFLVSAADQINLGHLSEESGYKNYLSDISAYLQLKALIGYQQSNFSGSPLTDTLQLTAIGDVMHGSRTFERSHVGDAQNYSFYVANTTSSSGDAANFAAEGYSAIYQKYAITQDSPYTPNNSIYFASGANQTLRASTDNSTLYGTFAGDTLIEGSGTDTIFAQGGDIVDVSKVGNGAGAGAGSLYLNGFGDSCKLGTNVWNDELQGWTDSDKGLLFKLVADTSSSTSTPVWDMQVSSINSPTDGSTDPNGLLIKGFTSQVSLDAKGNPYFSANSPWLGLEFLGNSASAPPVPDMMHAIDIHLSPTAYYVMNSSVHYWDLSAAWYIPPALNLISMANGATLYLDNVNVGDVTVSATTVGYTDQFSYGYFNGNSTDVNITLKDESASSSLTFRDGGDLQNVHPEFIKFADGTVWTYADLLSKANVEGGAHEYSIANGQTVAVNSASSGVSNTTTIDGWSNTFIMGSGVNNKFEITSLNNQNIVVTDFSSSDTSSDSLEFSAGLERAAVQVSRVGDDAVLFFGTKQSTVTLQNYFSDSNSNLYSKPIVFSDGTQWSYADISAMTASPVGSSPDSPVSSVAGIWQTISFLRDQSTGALRADISAAQQRLDALLINDPTTGLSVLGQFASNLRAYAASGMVDFNSFREHFLSENRDYGWAIDSLDNVVIHFDNNYGGYDAQPFQRRQIEGDLWGHDYYWNSLVYGGTGHVQFNSWTSGGHFVGVGGDKDSNISSNVGGLSSGVDSSNLIDGGAADDTLVGGTATNFLDGHGGSDLLIGGTGANVYFVSAQNGSAVIRNTRGSQDTTVDKIQFDSDVSSSDATFYQKGNDLLISIADGPQTLVENYFAPPDANGNLGAVAQLQFSDGTLITPADMADLLSVDDGSASHSLAAPQDDQGTVLTAWAEDTVLTAGSGADTLTGSRGNDTLIAGSGTALMAGHGGSNSYVFSLTSGDSVIDNTAYAGTAIDSLHFIDGILPGGLAFSPKGKDLVLTIKATGQSVTIKDFYNTAYNGNLISSVVFGDGTTWTRDAFAAWLATASADNPVVHAMAGPVDPTYGTQKYSATAGSADATLYATPNSTNANTNTLIGGSGNTTFYGAAGQYTFIQEGTGDSEIFTHPNDGVQGKGFLAVRSGGVGNTVLHAQEGDGTIQMGNFTSAPGNRVVIELDNTIRPEDVSTYYGGYATDFSWGNGLTIEFAQLDTGHPATVMSNPWSDAAEVFRFDNGLIWDKSYLAQNHQKLASTDVAGDSVQLVANGAVDTLYAGSGNDTLTAQIDNAWLFGGSGSDTFFGQTNALFSGGSGHSQMNAGTGVTIADGGLGGADVYLNWSQASHAIIQVDNGGGNDNVWLSSGAASIRFGFGINKADLDFVSTQNSLKIVVRSTGQTVEVQNWFESWISQDMRIEFMDGAALSYEQINDLLPANGAEGDVSIHARDGAAVLQAGSGNDTLYSSMAGNETILGGAGDDTIFVQGSGSHFIDAGSGHSIIMCNGYSSGQTYKFGHTSGNIHLQNYNWNSQKSDVLVIASDVTEDQIRVSMDCHYYGFKELKGGAFPPTYYANLVLTLDNGSSFTLDYALSQYQSGSPLDAIKFADGTTWTYRDLLNRIETHLSADGNAYLPAGANMAFADGSSGPLLGGGEKAGLFSYYSGSYIKGTAEETVIEADKGYAILQGGAGVNYLTSQGGYYDNSTYQYYNQPSLMDGGVGTSTIMGGDAVALGNKGNSTLSLWGSHDVILYNKGDGNDIVQSAGQNDTLSFGGGMTWSDLSFSKVGQDLIISSGVSSGTIDIQNWFADWFTKEGFNLQMFTNLSDEAAGATPQAQLLHLQDAVSAFSAAMSDNPALQSWNLGSSLQNFALTNESGAVLGGDLAHYYAMEGSFSGMSVSAAQAVLADAQFGSAQVLHDISSLQQSSNKILS